jgi:hypothetical protein
MQRLFFHSFPRPRKGETQHQQLEKGCRIADSILENGLLLSPENYDLPVLGNDRLTQDSFSAVQRRICFTELELEGLADHSKVFGPFALAFKIDDLRRLGALPVFYIPLESGGYLSGLAIEMLGGLVDAHRIASTLLMIQRQLSESPALGFKYRGKEINFSPEQADVIRSFWIFWPIPQEPISMRPMHDCERWRLASIQLKIRNTPRRCITTGNENGESSLACVRLTVSRFHTKPRHSKWKLFWQWITISFQRS